MGGGFVPVWLRPFLAISFAVGVEVMGVMMVKMACCVCAAFASFPAD